MASNIYDHGDDGEGRCGYCYEDWPCTWQTNGGYGSSGYHKWVQEERDKVWKRKQEERLQMEGRINALFREIGMELTYPRHSNTMTIKITDLIKMLEFFTARNTDGDTNTQGDN